MPTMPDHWKTRYESYPCPRCDAQPGEPCRTRRGHIADLPHAARTRQGARCVRCGAVLDHDDDSALCGYCSLRRQLAAEQARSTWANRHDGGT